MPRLTKDEAADVIAGALSVQARHDSIPGPRVISATFHADVGAEQIERIVQLKDDADGDTTILELTIPGILTGVRIPRGYVERFLAATEREDLEGPDGDESAPTFPPWENVSTARLIEWARADVAKSDDAEMRAAIGKTLAVCERLLKDVAGLSYAKADA